MTLQSSSLAPCFILLQRVPLLALQGHFTYAELVFRLLLHSHRTHFFRRKLAWLLGCRDQAIGQGVGSPCPKASAEDSVMQQLVGGGAWSGLVCLTWEAGHPRA